MNKSVLGLSLLALATLPASSLASDTKRYIGGSCQVASSSLIHKDGWAYNNSTTSSLTIDCPAVRDNNGTASLKVHAIDRHYSSDVSCYGASLTTGSGATGWSGWWTPVRSSSGSSSAMQELSLGNISGNSTSMLYITCTVPPKYSGNASGVFSYYVDEA